MRVETIGDCTLYLGDSLEIVPTLGEVDAVVADPNYGVMLGEVDNGQARIKKQQKYNMFSDTPEYVMAVCVPVVKLCIHKFGVVAVTTGKRNMFMYPPPDDMGVWWNSAGTSTGRWGYSLVVTPIFYYGKDPRAGKGRTPSSAMGMHSREGKNIKHPCPKPLAFTRWLVDKTSAKGQTILDPFMGSGTTGVACVELGRKFIGIEIDEKYFDIACERISRAERQGDLFRKPTAEQEKIFK